MVAIQFQYKIEVERGMCLAPKGSTGRSLGNLLFNFDGLI